MFLSRVEINRYRKETLRALASPQIMHAAIAASFPSADIAVSEKVLWRIDNIGKATYILVQSGIRPDFTHIIEQFGLPASNQTWDTLNADNFLASIENNQMWRFRLRANPVHSVKESDNDSRGKVFAHVTAKQQKDWLISRVQKNGFSIVKSAEGYCVDIKEIEPMNFKRGGDKVTINAVTFEGILLVEDRDLFIYSIKNGIGRAKAYGCGLLTIAKIQ